MIFQNLPYFLTRCGKDCCMQGAVADCAAKLFRKQSTIGKNGAFGKRALHQFIILWAFPSEILD